MLALALAAALALQDPAAPAPEQAPAVVHFADGTSQHMRTWSVSYEYMAWEDPTKRLFTQPSRRDAAGELWIGKKPFPLRGQTLEIQYANVAREVDGAEVSLPQPSAVVLTGADGKRQTLKPEPPPREYFLPKADKKLVLNVNSLDFKGETITGTRRELCLLVFSALMECTPAPDARVVKIEFPAP